MGFAFAMGNCGACGVFFTFNPVRVPSVRDKNGIKQPICKACIEHANVIRKEKGMDPFVYPKDAYDACDENEI